MALPLKILELEFTILEFHPTYVISRPREGQVLEGKQVADLVEVCSDFYKNKNFIYLSYRVNDYNVNPTVYLNLDEVKNLAGIGVVSKRSPPSTWPISKKNFVRFPMRSLWNWTLPFNGLRRL